jgi:hypothetical protein
MLYIHQNYPNLDTMFELAQKIVFPITLAKFSGSWIIKVYMITLYLWCKYTNSDCYKLQLQIYNHNNLSVPVDNVLPDFASNNPIVLWFDCLNDII